MKLLTRILAVSGLLFLVLFLFAFYLTHIPGGEKIMQKKQLIAKMLQDKYHTSAYLIISEKRPHWYNDLLPNAVDDSYHLKGMAVDFWVMDLNGDNSWDVQDINLMVKTIKEVEEEHPELAGGTYTYLNKSRLTSRMVHTDVRIH
ncbi:MAG: hypothetical protein KKA81_15165 [Bacteroidetes bacterium]|nr:hypothetical protein [Bacteroidota bacterium]